MGSFSVVNNVIARWTLQGYATLESMKTADIKAQIVQEVESIHPFDQLEREHIQDVITWINSGANLFRIAKPDKPPKHLVSYFVVVDPTHKQILLGDHIKAQLWLPSGGHVELNEHPRQAVVREAQEEINLEAKFLKENYKPHFITVTQTVGLTAGHTDVSLWYVLEGDIHEQLQFDRSEFTDMNWFSFDEILQSHPAIFDPHMQRFTKKLAQSLT